MIWRRLGITAAAVLLVLVAAFASASITPQVPRPVEPINVAGRSTVVCPTADGQDTYVASGREGGELAAGTLQSDPDQALSLNAVTELDPLDQPRVIAAQGGQTRGSGASVLAQRGDGPDRGISLSRCAEAGTSQWFVGLGATDDLRSEITLVNPDQTQVSVDLVFHGPNGEIATPGTRGIVVPAQGVREVPVEAHLDTPDLVAAEIRTQRGRVAATVTHRAGSDSPRGTAIGTSARLPEPVQIVPAIPGGPGRRTLVITNPSDRRATASIEVQGPNGPFVPVGGEQVAVNAAGTATVDLGPGLDQQGGGIRIEADQPITAAVVSTSSDDPNRQDIAVQPATDPLNAVSVAAVAAAPNAEAVVQITNAGDSEVTVPMRLILTNGQQAAETALVIPAHSTRPWVLPGVPEVGSVIADVPTGAPVHAGVQITTGGSFDGLGTSPLTVPEPVTEGIEPQPEAGLG